MYATTDGPNSQGDADLVPMKRELKPFKLPSAIGSRSDADLVPMKRELKVTLSTDARAERR